MELTETFIALLEGFAPVFTAPSFQTFQLLMTGWIMSVPSFTDLVIAVQVEAKVMTIVTVVSKINNIETPSIPMW